MNVKELNAKIFEGLATEEEFADAVGRNVRTIKRWRAKKNGLPTVTRGRFILIPIEQANAWMRGELTKPSRGRPRKTA